MTFDEPPPDSPLTLVESADLVGRYRYVELLAHRVLGERASGCLEAAICVFLESASSAHGYRSRLFERLLPVSVGLAGVVECTRSPHPSVDAAFDLLVVADDREVPAVLLGGIYPEMAESFRRHLVAVSPYCDPPVARVLRRALADLLAICADGEAFGASGAESDLGAAVHDHLARAGGVYGPMRRANLADEVG